MKICISCGMPMTKPEDYPMNDESRDYCVYCAKPDVPCNPFRRKRKECRNLL